MTSLEKSYLPQYIQYDSKPVGEYARLDNEVTEYSEVPEVVTFPAIPHHGIAIHSDTGGYQQNLANQTIYPPLTPQKNGIEPTHKTPLLAKKKKIVPTKTNFFGILLAFISGVFFTLCSGTVKYLTDIDPMELLIFRSLFQVWIYSLILVEYSTREEIYFYCEN